MPAFSEQSELRLATCHPELRRLFQDVVKRYDCTILEGKRSVEQQRANVAKGVSKTMDSRHLDEPWANAVDAAPYPLRWPKRDGVIEHGGRKYFSIEYLKQTARFYHFAGYVFARAQALDVPVRWGGDWDGDLDFEDQKFDDLPHWELLRQAA